MVSLYLYDGSFDGLLTAIFECFADRRQPQDIVNQDTYQASLLDELRPVTTDINKAERVIAGIDARSDGRGGELVYQLFLSEQPGIELRIYRLVHLLMRRNDPGILDNFADPDVLYCAQIQKMIRREVHRMHAFVRFQKATNDVFYAVISPDFDVIPLIGDHFQRRYADQSWVIFDSARHYGLFYDLNDLSFIDGDSDIFQQASSNPIGRTELEGQEDQYQTLWKQYFSSVTIQERRNIKLHLRHMPRRYWKYLVEKQVVDRKR